MIHLFCIITAKRKLKSDFRLRLLKVSKNLRSFWFNSKFRTKLSFLLIAAAILPTILATQGIVAIAESRLMESLQDLLQKDLFNFEQQLHRVEYHYRDVAKGLGESLELLEIDLSKTEPLNTISGKYKEDVLNALLRDPIETEFEPSFYLITDSQGRTVAQRIKILLESSEDVTENKAVLNPNYKGISIPVGIDISSLGIFQTAMHYERTLSSIELLNNDILKQLQLTQQASINIYPQQTQGIDKSSLGMVIIAVQPVKINHRLVGAVIVGNLLNRNYQIVDTVSKTSGVSTATLFAHDWHISTNVRDSNGKRIIGTRVSREVTEKTLNQGKKFIGRANIIGKTYQTAYAPIFDHRKQFQPETAKPIGIYYVGTPLAKIQQTLSTLAITGYSIGASIMCLAVIIVLPTANIWAKSIQRITDFAQAIGSGKLETRLKESNSTDEIGILEHELNQMADKIEVYLKNAANSELKIRYQAEQLETALQQLKQTQIQLVQKAKMASLAQLVAGIAHEINNPVSFIYGNIVCVKEDFTSLINLIKLYQYYYPEPPLEVNNAIKHIDLEYIESDLPNAISSIQTGAERIEKIVKSLKTFSRLDESEYKTVNMHENIDSILDISQSHFNLKNNQNIKVLKNYGHIPLVKCYAALFNQAVINILNNAVESLQQSSKKHPQIQISTSLILPEYIQISILDNGVGIPKDIKADIFNPFFTTKPVGQGIGMGLSISYQIITQKHNGTLECISKPGEGTEFIITIPI